MSKRFRADRARALVTYLHRSGVDPTACLTPPSRLLHHGCADPAHCPQHPGVTLAGEPMYGISTRLTGRQLHRLAVQLRLLD